MCGRYSQRLHGGEGGCIRALWVLASQSGRKEGPRGQGNRRAGGAGVFGAESLPGEELGRPEMQRWDLSSPWGMGRRLLGREGGRINER